MRRRAPVPWLVLAAGLLAPLAAAELSSSTAAPSPTRPVSSVVATMLADSAPKFAPAATKSAKSETNPVEREHSDADKPRNGIIRLPSYVVREDRPPQFKDRELLTERGRLDLALKRYPGLRLGSIGPLSNNVWAEALIEEDMGIERSQEMFYLLGWIPGAKPKPIFTGRPPWGLPYAGSGPYSGLVVPWERK